MQHDDLNDRLGRRSVPQTPLGLSERIIHAALMDLGQKYNQQIQKIGWWDEVASVLALPRPSMVLAFGIVLGLLVGVQASDLSAVATAAPDWVSFMEFNEGGWL